MREGTKSVPADDFCQCLFLRAFPDVTRDIAGGLCGRQTGSSMPALRCALVVAERANDPTRQEDEGDQVGDRHDHHRDIDSHDVGLSSARA